VAALDRLGALLADVVARTGPAAPAVLFFASFIEYVFPPFPGDTIVLLGAWYAVHGALSWPATFIAVTLGAVAGAVLDWRVGRALGLRIADRAALRGPLDARRFARFETSYRRHGPWLLAANRFLPGVRAFLFLAAGAARVPLREVLVFGGLSAAAWNALLLAVGAFLVRNFAEMTELFERYTFASTLVVAVVVALAVALAILRRRRGAVE
jgi:membrane protein DedA with SNARE-associated domain